MHVPLMLDGQLDAQMVADAADPVRVELAEAGRIAWSSALFRTADGWAVRVGVGEDAPLWRLDVRNLRPGAYLTLYSEWGREHEYRIVNVESA